MGDLAGRVIAVWGLTYKPGTDTLRRSSAVELCTWLHAQGAIVQAHDPAVLALPGDLSGRIRLCASPLAALSAAEALVVATEWPDYRDLPAQQVVDAMKRPLVLDANRFLRATFGNDPRIHYVAVGVPG